MDGPSFQAIHKVIEEKKDLFQLVSSEIWSHPELAFNEHFAHDLLTSTLEKEGFVVQRKYILPTAFRAEFSSGTGPTVSILCEYDALPEIGHACGHNLIAEAGLAASVALKCAMETDSTICGRLVVLGTPAEEGGAGKAHLIDKGAFSDIDIAMMVHPTVINKYFETTNAVDVLTVKYTGEESHAAAAPWLGLNALDAAVSAYSNISLLRQQMKPEYRIHGIIRKGGEIANIIPSETELHYLVRAPNILELEMLNKKVVACFKAAADATGCKVNIGHQEHIHKNLLPNSVLANIYKQYSEALGVCYDEDSCNISITSASTDMGNVSHVVPSIHPYYRIATEGTNHTKGFTRSSGSPSAQDPTLTAAKAMAMTSVHVMKHPSILNEINGVFREDMKR